MAEDDIYGSKKKYEKFKDNLNSLLAPKSSEHKRGSYKYYCRNPQNIEYFKSLFTHFEARDISFIRRLRLLQTMKMIVYHTEKKLADCERQDIDKLMAAMHNTYNSPKSKANFVTDMKHLWKLLFPELDALGRPDETVIPYVVRHVSSQIDRSRQKLRKDKLTWDDFQRLIDFFGSDPRIQAYMMLALESLGRPQELLYLKLKNIEHYTNYAKIYLADHGKEGPGLLQCIDSYPYLIRWLEIHPFKNDPEAFLFINIGHTNPGKQLRPESINKMLRQACRALGINKPITCYSLKRNGVTFRRLRGESDVEIQHVARWTSAKQLKTYDLSTQDEAYNLTLKKRGLIETGQKEITQNMQSNTCPYCNEKVGFTEKICPKCKHLLDRQAVISEQKKDEELKTLRTTVANMDARFENFKTELMAEIQQAKTAENQS